MKLKDLLVNIEFDEKTKLKLRAIAKHAEALADELDAIDHGWKCSCGSTEYQDTIMGDAGTDEVVLHQRKCNDCHTKFSMIDDELSTKGNE